MSVSRDEPLLAGRAPRREPVDVLNQPHTDRSDSDSDVDTLVHGQDGEEEKGDDDDGAVLKEHDEAETLLSRAAKPNSKYKDETKSKPYRRSRRSEELRRQAEGSGSASLMYEMEEGYKDSSSTSSRESLVLVEKTSSARHARSTPSRKMVLLFVLGISLVFLLLSFGSFEASQATWPFEKNSFHNGTHSFQATTLLISLDGFRADFLNRGLTPTMNALIRSGVSPKYMLPSFPSVTFPNHYTLVTGLYPESHGIVSNQFWDPNWEEEFYYTNISNSMQSKWWESAEPLWVTAEKQGLRTAIHMWPGSEAHIHNMDPTYLDKFKQHELLPTKVDRLLELLDMHYNQRPQLIAAYVPDVDSAGHQYGPNSTEIRATIAQVDGMLTSLLEGLLARNLTEIVNLVIVSDHGMVTTSVDRMIQLDDIIDMSLIDHIDGWPLRGLRLKNPERDIPLLYANLSRAAQEAGTFDVYTLDTMPERYHFSKNPRIAPIWVVPQSGWMVIEKEDFDIADAKANGREFTPKGLHGFDHEHPLMRAIFIARGPAFPHLPNSRVSVFQNTEVYNIVCDSIGVTPHNNNGTLRLPLKPIGLHGDYNEPALQLDDHGLEMTDSQEAPSEPPSSTDDTDTPSVDLPPSSETDTTNVTTPGPNGAKVSWWEYLHHQLEKAKEWAKEIIDSVKNNHADTAESSPQR